MTFINNLHEKLSDLTHVKPKPATHGNSIEFMNDTAAPPSEVTAQLRLSPLFSGLTDRELTEIAQRSHLVDLKEGQSLFDHGEPVHHFFFVVEGLIKLYRQSPSGQEKIIELENPGQTFAEALMFNDQPVYPVSAIAMKPSRVISISTRHFRDILARSPQLSFRVMGELSIRLHDLINEIDHLSLMTGRNRVAAYFLDQAAIKGDDFHLDIPKHAIASILSLQPESFSRLIKELVKRGAIAIQDSHIRILDQDELRRAAGII
jgi:CRP-like cAMP-binding protein